MKKQGIGQDLMAMRKEYVQTGEPTLGRSKNLQVRGDGKYICKIHGETVQIGQWGIYYCPECQKKGED